MRDVGDIVDATSPPHRAPSPSWPRQHERTRDGGSHARAARSTDLLRLQVGDVGRRARSPPRTSAEGRRRWSTAQLGGAVGTLGFYGELGPRSEPPSPSGSASPIPASRGSRAATAIAEFAAVMAGITGTLARIGNEVMELQRPEIGELRESTGRRRRRQHHDAAQAQPGSQRAPRHPRPPRPGQCFGPCSRVGPAPRARRPGVEGGVGGAPEMCLLTAAATAPRHRLHRRPRRRCRTDARERRRQPWVAGVRAGARHALRAGWGSIEPRPRCRRCSAAARRDGRSLAEAIEAAGLMTREEAEAARRRRDRPG